MSTVALLAAYTLAACCCVFVGWMTAQTIEIFWLGFQCRKREAELRTAIQRHPAGRRWDGGAR